MKEKKIPYAFTKGKRLASGLLAMAMSFSLLPQPVPTEAVALDTDMLLASTQQTMAIEPETLPSIDPTGQNDTVLPPLLDEDGNEILPEGSHWADYYLSKMVEYGYMRESLATEPDEPLTRAEFMSIINRAYGYTEMGDRTFSDVLETDWYYEDVSIATNAGFISGTSESTAEPMANLTRETTAYILGKNLMLPELTGENMYFEDFYEISDWSRGMVKSTSHYGLMAGYDDGTFKPSNSITRGEIAALVLQAVGTPLLSEGETILNEVFGNVTITEPGTILKNTIIAGDLHISNGIGLGGVTLENVTVLGRIVVTGGESEQGEASIVFKNVVASEMVVDNMDNQTVTVRLEGESYIENTYLRTNCYIEDNTTSENGLRTIEINAEPGTNIDLAGRIKEVFNTSRNTNVRVVSGTVDVMNIDESATEVSTEVLLGGEIIQLNIDVATNVTGAGDIANVKVNADDVVITILPDNIEIRPGVDANIAGNDMDSNTADEYSKEPRILSGYPIATDIAPSSFDAIFATNKPGTIYWAISNITQGSVPEEELIKPSSYGSVALQNGSFDVISGDEEVVQYIGDLEIGGNYYLTAMLVDERGEYSPIKVISFSTPDNSVPAFAEGYPYMSMVSATSAQVSIMTTKSCKVYFAVMAAGAMTPTREDFLAGAISGAEASGVVDATKNKELLQLVANTLIEQKEYVLHLWLTDADGMNYSEVVSLPFTTLDGTAPWFIQEPTATTIGVSDVTFSFSVNEDATVYWIAVLAGTTYPKPQANDTSGSATAPLDSEYAKLQVAYGMNGGVGSQAGNMEANANETHTFNMKGLLEETAYDLYFVAKDGADNYSIVGYTTFNTIDNTKPTFIEQTFSHTASSGTSTEGLVDQPYATTSITLVFSEGIQPDYFEGSTSQTFLQLYQAVQNANDQPADIIARNNLAAAMEFCFPFFTWNGNTPTAALVRNGDNESDDSIAKYDEWMIDYRFVTVQLVEGLMYINFPTVATDYKKSALHLSPGVTYGFKLQNIKDASYDGNMMDPAYLTLDKFTTVYAEVLLGSADIMVEDKPYARDVNGFEIDGQFANNDADLRITPQDMSNVNDSVVWDLRMNPNTFVAYNIYLRIVDSRGEYSPEMHQYYPEPPSLTYMANLNETAPEGAYASRVQKVKNNFEPDSNGWIFLRNDDINATMNSNPTTIPNVISGDGDKLSGVSLFSYFMGYQENTTSYPALNELGNDYQIELVFEVTKFNGVTTRGAWNGFLEIGAQIYAGNYSKVKDLGGFNTLDATMLQDLSLVSTPPDYEVNARFSDSIPPAWGYGAPKVDAGSLSADLSLAFDGRTGTAHYVVVKNISPINLGPTNEDGTPVLAETVPSIDSRYWVEGGEWPVGGNPNLSLSTPTVETILDNVNYGIVNTGSVDVGTIASTLTLEDLDPLQEYYVYLVTRSSTGGDYSGVYLYKFTTLETEKPKYDPDPMPNTNTGDVDVVTHVDSYLDYLMVSRSALANSSFKFLIQPFYEVLGKEGEFLSKYAGLTEVTKDPTDDQTYADPTNTSEFYTYQELYMMKSKEFLRSDAIYIQAYKDTLTAMSDYLGSDPTHTEKDAEYLALAAKAELNYDNINTVLDVLAMEYNKSDNYDHEDYTDGYTIFDVFASPALKTDLYTLMRGFSDRELLGKNGATVETAAGEKYTALTDPNATKDPDFEYLFLVTAKNVEAIATSVSETNTFRAIDKYRIIDNSSPKLNYLTTNGVEDLDEDGVALGSYSGSLSIVFDKNLFATGAGDTAPVYFVQLSNEEPNEFTWPSGITRHINDMMVLIPSGSSSGKVRLFSQYTNHATLEEYSDYDANLFAKSFVLTYDNVKVGDQLSFFGSQLYPSSSSGIPHSPQNLTFTFGVVKSEAVTEEVPANSGQYKTTIEQTFGWISNWDDIDDTEVKLVVDSTTHVSWEDRTKVDTVVVSPSVVELDLVATASSSTVVSVTPSPFQNDGILSVVNNAPYVNVTANSIKGISTFTVTAKDVGTSGYITLIGKKVDGSDFEQSIPVIVKDTTVVEPPAVAEISLYQTATAIEEGKSFGITATVENASAAAVTWTATEGVELSTDSGGRVTVKGVKPGTHTITAMVDGVETSTQITVAGVGEPSISINTASVTAKVGEPISLKASVTELNIDSIVWTGGSNTTLDYSNRTGGNVTITGLKKGTYTVYAQVGKVSSKVQLIIEDAE